MKVAFPMAFGGLFFIINIGIMIYMVYLFHVLATSNKQIAETLERLVDKIDRFDHRKLE
ncbi:hypothetical protein SAMN02745975_02800 [Geosporobacter subterraneus DSM 17957]|uniref:Uncharacterized protein n=1 Tax=Geosporobacter subterraneus DSM 17957 TaxID=1121919 RepID=A0A1M6LXQ1_9FIRM|nr:hypothetical protein [Geosporobacter subterraneus]SHJ75910.1 hypothetical protein SAMN02745975_02800 [Geosporobacter subterraneus DSM 17957]